MDTKQVALVIADISGYTHFIRTKKVSGLHAEEIIFDLLETVINHSEHPLTLNKLEGDAIFLYAELTSANQPEVLRDVARQAQDFFIIFRERVQALTQERAECACNACQRVHDLRLKVVLHCGEAMFKHIRQFEELAGEDVITIHRLLKNSIPSREYILMTEAFQAVTGQLSGLSHMTSIETYADLGELKVHVFTPYQQPPK
jgi:class 3 adenylate cyclase